MEAQQDFKELLELFNANSVEYMIVGGYALAFHGAPRYTGDIDLLVRPCPENAKNILKALHEFGFGNTGISIDDFIEADRVIQLGLPPVRIDIATSITGVTWEQAANHRVAGHYGDVPTFYIGRDDFIANKKACGRHKDLADVESLDESVG